MNTLKILSASITLLISFVCANEAHNTQSSTSPATTAIQVVINACAHRSDGMYCRNHMCQQETKFKCIQCGSITNTAEEWHTHFNATHKKNN